MTETMNYGTYGAPRRRTKNADARREAMAARRSAGARGPADPPRRGRGGGDPESSDGDFGEPVPRRGGGGRPDDPPGRRRSRTPPAGGSGRRSYRQVRSRSPGRRRDDGARRPSSRQSSGSRMSRSDRSGSPGRDSVRSGTSRHQRSRSWNGRTRHYDRDRPRSFVSASSASRGPSHAEQVSKFDLVRSRSAGRASSRGGDEAAPPAASGARQSPYSAAASRLATNVDSMKSYLADRVGRARSVSAALPARVSVPLLGPRGCRKRSAARIAAASADGGGGVGVARKRSEDGSSASRTCVTEGTDSEACSEGEECSEDDDGSCSSYESGSEYSEDSEDSDPFNASEMEGRRRTTFRDGPSSSVRSDGSGRDGTNDESYGENDESYEANGESYRAHGDSYGSTAGRSYASGDEGSYGSSEDGASYHSSDVVDYHDEVSGSSSRSASTSASASVSPAPRRADAGAALSLAGQSRASVRSAASSHGGRSRASAAASAGRLARLLEENESLRRSVLTLRKDFEAMLRAVDALGGDEATADDGSSVATESSRISECLRRIDEVRSAARLRLRERSRRAPAAAGGEAERIVRERLGPYRDCIEDLLEENGRLYDQVAELTRERDEGMRGGGGGQGAADTVPRTEEELVRLLTDEGTAASHGELIEDMAELVEDMSSCVTGGDGERERAGRLGSEIMGLVARIMGQRRVARDMRASTTSGEDEMNSESCGDAPAEDGADDGSPDADAEPCADGGTSAGPTDEGDDDDRNMWSLCTVESGSSAGSGACRDGPAVLPSVTAASISLHEEAAAAGERAASEDAASRLREEARAVIERAREDAREERQRRGRDGGEDDDGSTVEVEYDYGSDGSETEDEKTLDEIADDEDEDSLMGEVEHSSDEDAEVPRHYESAASLAGSGHRTGMEYSVPSPVNSRYSPGPNLSGSEGDLSTRTMPGVGIGSGGWRRVGRAVPVPPLHARARGTSSSGGVRAGRPRSLSSSRTPGGGGYDSGGSAYHSDAPPRSRPSPVSSHATSAEEEVEAMLMYGKGLSYHSHASSCGPSIAEGAREDDEDDGGAAADGEEAERADREQRRDGVLPENPPASAGDILSMLMADGGLGGASLRRIESLSTCRSMSASERTLGDSAPCEDDSQDSPSSVGGDSTRERRGISITVVSRASGRCAFPSSRRHTYVTYFRHDVSKGRVDDVLEEQLVEGREEALMGCSFATDAATHGRVGDGAGPRGGRRRKYRGERNAAGERHGYGIYTSRNGNEYRGEWYEDRREGLGVVKVGNGDVFEGQFESNLKSGIGVYHYGDGECDLSLYRDDVRVGDSVRYTRDRSRAFLLTDDMGSREITLAEAAETAKLMGCIVNAS